MMEIISNSFIPNCYNETFCLYTPLCSFLKHIMTPSILPVVAKLGFKIILPIYTSSVISMSLFFLNIFATTWHLLGFFVLGLKPRAQHILGKCSTTSYTLSSLTVNFYYICISITSKSLSSFLYLLLTIVSPMWLFACFAIWSYIFWILTIFWYWKKLLSICIFSNSYNFKFYAVKLTNP